MTSVRASTRSDSRANRARLVAAARELFRERGLGCDVKDIAEHAGVGIGTVYRNFASKEELTAAVVDEIAAEIATEIEKVLREPDPFRAVSAMIDTALHRAALDGALLLSLGEQMRPGGGPPPRVIEMVRTVFERAQAAGAIRQDVPVEVLFRYMRLHFALLVDVRREYGSEDAHRFISSLLRSALHLRDAGTGPR